jgi:hypothetical protein
VRWSRLETVLLCSGRVSERREGSQWDFDLLLHAILIM